MSDDAPHAAPEATPGPYRRQLVRNTAATGLANGWTMLLTIVSVPLMLRGLGTTAFGLWALLQTFSAITGWMSLADLGIGMATVREVADAHSRGDDRRTGRTIATAIAAVAAMGAGWGLVLAVGGTVALPSLFEVPDELTRDFRLAVALFSIQVVLDLVGSMIGWCLDGLQRVDWSRALDSGRRTAIIGASVVLALTTGDLAAVFGAAAAAALGALVVAVVVLLRQQPGPLGRPDREIARGLLHYGRRVWLLNTTGVVQRTMDRLVVGVALGPSAVALVEIATQVQSGVTAVIGSVTNAVTGSAAWVRGREDEAHLRELLERATKYTCLAALPLCAIVAVLARPMLEVWVGDDYLDAAVLVVLGCAFLATQAPIAAGSNLLLGVGRAGAVLRPAALAVAVNLVLSILLVQTIGVAGAFWATLVSSAVLTPMLARAVSVEIGESVARLVRVAVVPALGPTLAAGVVAGGIALVAGHPAVATFVGFAAGLAAAGGVGSRTALSLRERAELLAVLPGR